MPVAKAVTTVHGASPSQRVYLSGLLIYLYSQVLDGPLRYLLDLVGAVPLLYARDAILLLIISHAVLTSLIRWRINAALFSILLTLGAFSIVALIYVENILQILFSLKLMLPLIVGAICGRSVSILNKFFKRHFIALFLIAVSGVLLHSQVKLPWIGGSYEIQGIQIERSFERNTTGFDRLTGFSRSNFEVASQVLLLWIFIHMHEHSRIVRGFYWLCAGSAILLSTTKGIIATFLIINFVITLFSVSIRLEKIKAHILFSILSAMVALPLLSREMDVDVSNPDDVFIFASFNDRIINGWPPVIDNIFENGNVVTGRGVGGTGAGEHYFSQTILGAPDNLFVYLFSWFGLFGVLMLLLVCWKSRNLQVRSASDYTNYLWLLAIYTFGLSSSTIESPFFATIAGLVLIYVFSNRNHNEKLSRRRASASSFY
jgi:hypothetical protein